MAGSELRLLYLVANAGFGDDIVEIVREAGVKGATIINARGEGARHESILGITIDTEKELILCVSSAEIAEKATALIKEKAGITTPANCVCFTMKVSDSIGIS
jgi:hypothetical protein